MSTLWNLSHIRPQTEVVMAGDTIPAFPLAEALP